MFRYRKILVPLDGSALAEKALHPALSIAKAMDSELHCLQIITGLALEVDPEFGRRLTESRKQAADNYLNNLKTRFSEIKQPVQLETMVGSAGQLIIDAVKKHHIDLVVLSSHGRSGLERWVYGNVTAKIVRQAPCDRLIIRTMVSATPFLSTRRIMVPLDGSQLAEQALKPAVALVKAFGGELLLFRVSPLIPSDLEPMISRSMINSLESRAREETITYLSNAQQAINHYQVPIRTKTVTGHDAAAIVDCATKHQADLIVMASHGRSGIGLWLLGSVTEKVLRKANCATLVVRSK